MKFTILSCRPPPAPAVMVDWTEKCLENWKHGFLGISVGHRAVFWTCLLLRWNKEPERAEARMCKSFLPRGVLKAAAVPLCQVPHFLSLWTQTLASSFPGRSQASSLDWGSSLALPCSKAPSFSAWAAAGSLYFPACRQSLWIRTTSAVVSQLTTFPICKLTYILLGFLLLRTPACVCRGGGGGYE